MGRSATKWVLALAMLVFAGGRPGGFAPPEMSGRVVDEAGRAVPGALVTVRHAPTGRAFTVYADGEGRYALTVPEGPLTLEVRGPAAEATSRTTRSGPASELGGDVALAAARGDDEPPASAFLAQLPDGEAKRRFIVDCGGCHTFDALRARKDGRERTRQEWHDAIALMLSFSGQGSGFPIISGAADAERDAAWLAGALQGAPWPVATAPSPDLTAGARGAVLTEYDVPVAADLPHDVAWDGRRLLVTGMMTHRMYTLDPVSGTWETVPIPVARANPRAVDVAADGRWLVALGAPRRLAFFDPAGEAWTDVPVGTYPHSIVEDARGRVWFNGHFSSAPEIVGYVDPATREVRTYEIPGDGGESTIPYGLRVGPDGTVWGTQLRGNRLVRLDPETGDVRRYTLPTTQSGPRRPDVGVDGVVWIPEFGAGKLARFDPATERFTEVDFPVPDAGPYVARVDRVRGTVWIGTGHSDVVAAYDPGTERFTLYPLPTRGALIRHLDVDEATGAVWVAYGASPGIPGKILRIQP